MRQETLEKVKKVMTAVEAGESATKACERIGVSDVTFYTYRRKLKGPARGRRKTHKVVAIPGGQSLAGNPEKVFVFFGSPESVAQAARGLM